MRVFVERNVVYDSWDVTVYERAVHGSPTYEVHEGFPATIEPTGSPVQAGESVPVTLRLPTEVVDALIEEVRGIKPGEVLADSVADARRTRDDILRLHERTVDFIMRTARRDFTDG